VSKGRANFLIRTKNPASSPAKRLGEEKPGLRCKDKILMDNALFPDIIISKEGFCRS